MSAVILIERWIYTAGLYTILSQCYQKIWVMCLTKTSSPLLYLL